VRPGDDRSLDRVVGERDVGVGASLALALGVDFELVLAQPQAGDESVILAPFNSMRTLPRLTSFFFTVMRTSASPPETM